MDSRSVAAAAVKKNLGPDPSMGRKVELLRRLVSMRKERMPGYGVRPKPGGGFERVPFRGRRPARFSDKPGYNFGPPRGV